MSGLHFGCFYQNKDTDANRNGFIPALCIRDIWALQDPSVLPSSVLPYRARVVSADAVSSELSPGVDCRVFHRKADKRYRVIELISSTLATRHQNINTLNVLKECSFRCLALDMPQLGKFNLLEGCCVTAEWDRTLSYYWSLCHSGFVFWHLWCEVCLPQGSPRSVFRGEWRCIGIC